MLYKLWEDGLLDSLDDPLEKYLDGFTIKNPLGGARSGSSGLTLRRMASQLSGNADESRSKLRWWKMEFLSDLMKIKHLILQSERNQLITSPAH